jgi:CheY-like chemotaxis protein
MLHQNILDTVNIIKLQAEKKGLDVKVSIARSVPQIVFADPVRLRQILLNLLSNSVKFTDVGSIEVGVDIFDPARIGIVPQEALDIWDKMRSNLKDGYACVHFSVRDTGIGISEEVKDTIFETFTQGDSSISKKYKGAGLGLSICKRLATLMGGHLWFESTAGSGSTFHFTVTLKRHVDILDTYPKSRVVSIKAVEDESARKPLTILVADDKPTNLLLATNLLRRDGHHTVSVTDGEEVLQALSAQAFDLILLDIQMPNMDGYEVTKTIRDQEKKTGNHIPIIAMTANAMKGDRQKCLDAGMDDYIAKPIRRKELRIIVSRWTRGRAAVSVTEPVSVSAPGNPEINEEIINSLRAMGDDFFSEIMRRFLSDTEGDIEQIGSSFASGDMRKLHDAACGLRGASSTIGAKRLETICRDLQHKSENNDTDVMDAMIELLDVVYENTCAEIRKMI